eukprot:3043523-Amphidinium_carterae.1
MSDDLGSLLRADGVSDRLITALKATPFAISTVTQFANEFENKAEVKTVFVDQLDGETVPLAQIANLKQAWREADALNIIWIVRSNVLQGVYLTNIWMTRFALMSRRASATNSS